MYKIIFLDDEAMTVKLLEHAIDWQRHGIALCGAASDGEEGIALFGQVEPDIVITDIRMPRMNGIELAAAIRRSGKKVKILLLSAYAEFEYAHSAITYEISEYLLKPLDEDKLEAAITRVVQELDRERAMSSTIEHYRLEQAEKQLQQFFPGNRGAQQNMRLPTLLQEIATASGNADTYLYCVRSAEPDGLDLPGDIETVRLLLKQQLGPITAVAVISPVELIALTGGLRPGQMESVFNDLRRQGHPLLVGFSRLTDTMGWGETHRQAVRALDACFYAGETLGSASPATPALAGEIPFNLAEFAQPIAALVEQGQGEELNRRLQDALAELLRRRVEPLLIYHFVFDILSWLKLESTRQQRTSAPAGLGTISRERLRACASGAALAAYIDCLLRTVSLAVRSLLAEEPGYYVVRQAKEYARQHYCAAQFSLLDVAIHVGLSKNHFSQVFHKVTGQKFWDYVTQLRMEKAKELLKQGHFSNYEISRAIGYESEFYFSKVFKREAGVTPQQYRKL